MVPVVAVVGGVVACAIVVVLVLVVRGRGGGGGGGGGPRMPLQQAWQQAAPMLAELGLHAIDAECFNNGRLYVKLELASGGVWAWLDQSYGGGMLDAHPGATTTLRPGGSGHGDLGRWLAAEVGAALAALPRGAELSVAGPEIAGADCKLSLRAPVRSPDHVAAVARVMLALDAAARRPAAPGAASHANVPRVVELWRAAGPALEALGLHALDAECYTAERLFVRFDLGAKAVYAWFEATTPGGQLDAFPRATASLHPGGAARSELARWIAANATDAFAALPHRATLDVVCPEIPGAEYKVKLMSPLQAADDTANVARVLQSLAAACRQPAGAGSAAELPPVVAHWMAAAPALEALGLTRVDAELYTRGSLYVSFELAAGGVRAWLETSNAGGVLDGFCGQCATLHPGRGGGSELARHVAALAQPALGSLHARAHLEVTAPEIPGAEYKLALSSPLSAPEHAVAVAQVMVALEAAL